MLEELALLSVGKWLSFMFKEHPRIATAVVVGVMLMCVAVWAVPWGEKAPSDRVDTAPSMKRDHKPGRLSPECRRPKGGKASLYLPSRNRDC